MREESTDEDGHFITECPHCGSEKVPSTVTGREICKDCGEPW